MNIILGNKLRIPHYWLYHFRMLNSRRFVSFESRLAKLQGGRIGLTFDSDIATVTLDNVKKHNALSGQMMLEFRKCVEELEKNHTLKAVVFTGAGNKAFCAGSDLDCLTEFTDSEEGMLQLDII